MISFVAPPDNTGQIRHVRRVWWAGYAVTVMCGLFVGSLADRRIDKPFVGLSLAIMLVILVGWVIRPVASLYAVVFLTCVSDIVTLWWFPFAKNLSSRESISFVSDALTFSPLEISLYLGFAVSTIRRYATSRTLIPRTPITWPLITFSGFVVFGYFRGLSAGGNLRIAILEGRTLFYILLLYMIVVNECTERRQLHRLLWAAIAGVFVQSLLSMEYLSRLDSAQRATLESLNEHGSTLGHALMIVTCASLILFKLRAPVLRFALLLALIPTVYVFFVGQRRSGVAALGVGICIVLIALLWRRRTAFLLVAPTVAAVLTLYVVALGSSDSTIAYPAQAIKTIVTPGSASAEDESSDFYRRLEHFNLNYTIRTDPVTGQGFGRPFLRPLQLADISFFELNAYVPHNSVLWIWIKLGFGGFVSMFFLFATTILAGADRVRRATDPLDLAVVVAATAFVVMYAVYSYVDVSWDARNTVLLAVAFAICAGDEVERPGIVEGGETHADIALVHRDLAAPSNS